MASPDAASSCSSPRPFSLPRAILAVFLSGLFAFGLWTLYTRQNNFPSHYHPDEPTKVGQLLDDRGRRNFNHPLLMLRLAELNLQRLGNPQDRQDVVEAGRDVSAAAAAGAVMCLMLAAYAAHGFTGLGLAGVSLGLCAHLFVLAHYLKEDTSLALGLGVAMLGATLVVRARLGIVLLLASIVLGAGVAASASGKYVGAAMLVPAVAALLIAPVTRRVWLWRATGLGVMLLVALVLTVVINLPAFENAIRLSVRGSVVAHIREQFDNATTAHGIVALATPNLHVLRVVAGDLAWPMWAAGGVAGLAWIGRPRFTRVGVLWLVAWTTWVIVLSFNAIPFARYALPVTLLTHLGIACLVAAMIARLPRATHRVAAGVGVIGLVALIQGDRIRRIESQIVDDSRERVRVFVATELPADARVVAERYSGLDGPGDRVRHPDHPRLRQRVSARMFASDAGDYASVARRFDYVVVSEPTFGRFFVPGVGAAPGNQDRFDSARAFYAELFEKGQLVWQSVPDPPTRSYVNPEIRVYRVRASP